MNDITIFLISFCVVMSTVCLYYIAVESEKQTELLRKIATLLESKKDGTKNEN